MKRIAEERVKVPTTVAAVRGLLQDSGYATSDLEMIPYISAFGTDTRQRWFGAWEEHERLASVTEVAIIQHGGYPERHAEETWMDEPLSSVVARLSILTPGLLTIAARRSATIIAALVDADCTDFLWHALSYHIQVQPESFLPLARSGPMVRLLLSRAIVTDPLSIVSVWLDEERYECITTLMTERCGPERCPPAYSPRESAVPVANHLLIYAIEKDDMTLFYMALTFAADPCASCTKRIAAFAYNHKHSFDARRWMAVQPDPRRTSAMSLAVQLERRQMASILQDRLLTAHAAGQCPTAYVNEQLSACLTITLASGDLGLAARQVTHLCGVLSEPRQEFLLAAVRSDDLEALRLVFWARTTVTVAGAALSEAIQRKAARCQEFCRFIGMRIGGSLLKFGLEAIEQRNFEALAGLLDVGRLRTDIMILLRWALASRFLEAVELLVRYPLRQEGAFLCAIEAARAIADGQRQLIPVLEKILAADPSLCNNYMVLSKLKRADTLQCAGDNKSITEVARDAGCPPYVMSLLVENDGDLDNVLLVAVRETNLQAIEYLTSLHMPYDVLHDAVLLAIDNNAAKTITALTARCVDGDFLPDLNGALLTALRGLNTKCVVPLLDAGASPSVVSIPYRTWLRSHGMGHIVDTLAKYE